MPLSTVDPRRPPRSADVWNVLSWLDISQSGNDQMEQVTWDTHC